MNVYCLNNISKVALNTLENTDNLVSDIKEANSILVRSFDMHELDLDESIYAVARAGAGVNNIPLEKYAKKGIVVFNTPGANANAVKELVICALLLSSRGIIEGNEWIKENKDDLDIAKTVEKNKSKFAGNEIFGKKIAVLGLGKIGILVANACAALGMKVIGYDPYLTVSNAMKIEKDLKYVETLEDAINDVDFITIHIPANDQTKGLLNKKEFDVMKKGTTILNFSRDVLVNESELNDAINEGIVKKYVTDFANPIASKLPNTICLPHLGASTEEAEDNCALMAINQLKDYLENGNITNSVNYPTTNAGLKGNDVRICINHYNVPGMIANFTTVLSNENINIANLINKSKGEYAYTIIDVDKNVDIESIKKIGGVLRVRIL